MKTAIFVEDGVFQVVITPETDFEKNAIEAVSNESMEVSIWRGEFYACQGGWNRMQNYPDKNSLMIRAVKQDKEAGK